MQAKNTSVYKGKKITIKVNARCYASFKHYAQDDAEDILNSFMRHYNTMKRDISPITNKKEETEHIKLVQKQAKVYYLVNKMIKHKNTDPYKMFCMYFKLQQICNKKGTYITVKDFETYCKKYGIKDFALFFSYYLSSKSKSYKMSIWDKIRFWGIILEPAEIFVIDSNNHLTIDNDVIDEFKNKKGEFTSY